LLGRKVLPSEGKLLLHFTALIDALCTSLNERSALAKHAETLANLKLEWLELTAWIGLRAQKNPDEVGGAAVDYLMYSGYIVLAYFWLSAMAKASEKKTQNESSLHQEKIDTGDFYFARILPRTLTLSAVIRAGANCMMNVSGKSFAN
jgi:hypothetical protein